MFLVMYETVNQEVDIEEEEAALFDNSVAKMLLNLTHAQHCTTHS